MKRVAEFARTAGLAVCLFACLPIITMNVQGASDHDVMLVVWPFVVTGGLFTLVYFALDRA